MTCEAVRRRGTQLVDGTNNVQNSKRAPPPYTYVLGVVRLDVVSVLDSA